MCNAIWCVHGAAVTLLSSLTKFKKQNLESTIASCRYNFDDLTSFNYKL